MAASVGCSQIIYCHRAKNIVTLVHSVSITCFPHRGEVVWRIFFSWLAGKSLSVFRWEWAVELQVIPQCALHVQPSLSKTLDVSQFVPYYQRFISSVYECITSGEIQQLQARYQFHDVHICRSLSVASTTFVERSSVRLEAQARIPRTVIAFHFPVHPSYYKEAANQSINQFLFFRHGQDRGQNVPEWVWEQLYCDA